MKLYLKKGKQNFKTRKDFIIDFIKNQYETYSDENCSILQTEKGRYRSLSELYILVSTYYKTSFNGFIKIIKDLMDKEYKINLVWCTTVKKVVIKYEKEVPEGYITNYSLKKYYNEIGEDGYSLKQIEEMFNKLKK